MKTKLSIIILAAALFCINPLCAAEEQVIELKFSHFMPEKHVQHKDVIVPWAKNIEQLTNGKIRITIYSNQAVGKASEQYDLVVKGDVDIAFGLPAYTPDRFPLISGMTLPFMVKSGESGAIALWNLYEKYLKEEFKDVKVLWLFCHGPGHIHTTKKPVKTLEDFKNMKIRSPNPAIEKVLHLFGAVPITVPITQGYEALKNGDVEGITVPWEAMMAFKFNELCKYHTVADIYTMPFFVVMNKQKYDAIPSDIRKIMDENCGEKMSASAGKAFDAEDAAAMKHIVENGGNIYLLPEKERERWKDVGLPVGDQWVKEMKSKGLPSQQFLESAIETLMMIQ